MKKTTLLLLIVLIICSFVSCNQVQEDTPNTPQNASFVPQNATSVVLSDDAITVNGAPISTDNTADVYAAHDIVYYEAGKDFTYGEGSEADAHSTEEAAAHTVVHITKAGTYALQGKLSLGQIAIDLGADAKKDPNAVVTLILNGVDITCEVAPAIIFYKVYECGSDDTETATQTVDTSAAGANVVIADGTVNTVNGSYVARIYKPDSVVLNADGTAVEDADKLHKYDAAFYSKMSMNVGGGEKNNGVLNIQAQNEGLDSELHLTINGGIINITSGNDGINTNEDGVSVTTVNGGCLTIHVTGETGEGDGIDSNGWLVINGGSVNAYACALSGDAGIDSDMGIYINGGTVLATGNMLDRIAGATQNCAIFNFQERQSATSKIVLKGSNGVILDTELKNDCSILIFSSPELKADKYELSVNDVPFATMQGGNMGNPSGMGFNGEQPPQMPEGEQPPQMPEGEQPPQMPEGEQPPQGNGNMMQGGRPNTQIGNTQAQSKLFDIKDGINTFHSVAKYTANNNAIIWIVIVAVLAAGLVVYSIVVTVKLAKKKKQVQTENK